MIPLIPALALAFFSFLSSAFVILRIVIPILPPSPLSKRVSPAEFGLPAFQSLSPADKSHIWLAALDTLALAVFVWQAVNEAIAGPSDLANAFNPASSVRLWFAMTIRQACLLIVASITLLHLRMGRSVSFGAKHWMLWAPMAILTGISIAIAGVMSGAGLDTFFVGLASYTSMIAILSTVAFTCLIGTLIIIKRNLTTLNEDFDSWPSVRVMKEKPRLSFATEDIDAIRDGASWLTSDAGSRHGSISAWSFSTHHTAPASSHHGHNRVNKSSYSSVIAKSNIWLGSSTANAINVHPVSPLPSPSGPESHVTRDSDPFRHDSPSPAFEYPRVRLDSQTSWLTSTNGSHSTMSAWSYPPSEAEGSLRSPISPDFDTVLTPASRPVTPQLADTQVLGGHGYAPGSHEAEKCITSPAAPLGTTVDISVLRLLGWLIYIWVPIVLSLPYLIMVSQKNAASSAISVLLILSVSMSSPILALIILFQSPIPVPSGLFDVHFKSTEIDTLRVPSPNAPFKWSHEYRRSMSTSVTVVERRRSGDVWLSNGDAVDGQSKAGRAVGMLNPTPKLSVLPPEEDEAIEFAPPLPIQNEDSLVPIGHKRSHSESSAQFSRLCKDSKASSHHSGARESFADSSKIMIAQRHCSALAHTVVVSGTSENPSASKHLEDAGIVSASGAATSNAVWHSTRIRSASSINRPTSPDSISFHMTPPPSIPLPPTPLSVKAARLKATLTHRKSFSSEFSFGRVDDVNQIDALTAGVLPLLVPGINMDAMGIKEGEWTPPGSFGKSRGKKLLKEMKEFKEDLSAAQIHSTPPRRRAPEPRSKKVSAHRRNHMSLPSLGLGKDGNHYLAYSSADLRGALETKIDQYCTAVPTSNIEIGRRNPVFGGAIVPNIIPHLHTKETRPEIQDAAIDLNYIIGLRDDGLHGLDTPRELMTLPPQFSAASTDTLFEEFVAGLDDPKAHSTPHNSVLIKSPSKYPAPPLPLPKHDRCSSIVYVKSEDQLSPTSSAESTTASSTTSAIAQWSTWGVLPLTLQLKMFKADSAPSSSKLGSPGGNLRPLTLLGNRDSNAHASPVMNPSDLCLSGRNKTRGAAPVQDENVYLDSLRSRSKGLKPLKLARPDTAKMRGLPRQGEVLPDVVVCPPVDSLRVHHRT